MSGPVRIQEQNRSSKMHTDALLIEKSVTGPYSNHARSPSAMALPPAAPRARDRRRITCRRRHARRDARGAHHMWFPPRPGVARMGCSKHRMCRNELQR
jgi:hypothetical protein